MNELLNLGQYLDEAREKKALSFGVRLATLDDIDQLVPLINTAYMYENEGATAFKKPDALRINLESLTEAIHENSIIVATQSGDMGERIVGSIQYKEIPPSPGSSSTQHINAYFGMK